MAAAAAAAVAAARSMLRVSATTRHGGVRAAGTLTAVTKAALADIKAAGTYKTERVISSPQAGHIKVTTLGARPVLNMCANNYIGFADNKEVRGKVPS